VIQRGEAIQNRDLRSWYVLYTKPRWERKIAETLARLGIESYCPLNKVERYWSDRRKVVSEPLFSCYVFVRLADDELVKPLEINGVFRYVCKMNKPARVRNEEIETIRLFLAEHGMVHLEKISVRLNDKIEILYGPFMSRKGLVTKVHPNYLKVNILSLGYSLVATVRRTGIRKLDGKGAEMN
jgi:transcription antitermination factor NusG